MTYVAPNSIQARDIASVVHPQTNLVKHLADGPMVIERGRGCYVYDDNGTEFLDAAAGLWCASLGYASERLAKVAYEQMRKLGYYHLYRGTTNESGVDLAEKLLSIAPVPMSKVLFQCSGSEANDTALKLVWYYHAAIGKPEKRKVIGRHMAYHGSTSASISASGKPDMHADFGLPFPGFLHTEYPHYYRHHQDGESEEQFATRMAEALEALILREGPETCGAFIAEPVMGAGGGLTPPRSYWEKMQAVIRKYDMLFIADEVICGFGRTGNMWGSQTYALEPDMISCAKALSAGMQPISALLVNQRVFDAMLDESRKLGNFAHGFTYAGHPVTTAVAMETLRIYEEMDMIGHVQRVGPYLQAAMAKFADHPLVGEVRGVGLLTGIEMVQDKATRRLFDPARKLGATVDKHARSHGLITRFIGDRIAFSPPLIVTEAEIDEIAARLGRALDDTWAEVRAA
ncbi:MAG: aspartate aminotransferase family protein [Rhodospirillales bacterium 69-11]|nr:aminotransferase class III-fold pyridoxal phosphate-dependent enzyme [Rhodospirillales bacterium]OJW24399.1 MAG: aspartate aminotransferase family protein [Rhodospirillales bacterium 69-11]